jgi:hypothetical protein
MSHVVVIEMTPCNWDLGRKCTLFSRTPLDIPYEIILVASCISDPLIGHGRHFGRTVHALCNIQVLLTNGILRLSEQGNEPEESLTAEYIQTTNFISLRS